MTQQSPGPGVDARGREVIDPTQNVLDLVQAAILRQDDLRKAESSHVRQVVKLHTKYNAKLAKAESARIDAIHVADVAAADRLATQVETTAVALRQQVEAQRVATAEGLAQALQPMQTTMSELTKALYSGQGGVAATQEAKVDRRSVGESWQAWAAVGAVLVVAIIGFLASHYK